MFESNGKLFFLAEENALQAKKFLNECETLIDDFVVTDSTYYKDAAKNIQECPIENLIKFIEAAKNRLIELDTSFSADYFNEQKAATEFESLKLDEIGGQFCELTDKQYNAFGFLSYSFVSNWELYDALETKYDENGNVIKEHILSEIDSNASETYKQDGIGDFIIEEVITDDYGCKILVLKDDDGNYTMLFPSTYNPLDPSSKNKGNISDYYDILYDLYPIFGKLGIFSKDDDDNVLLGFLISQFPDLQPISSKLYETCEKVYNSQRETVKKISEKYYKKAFEEGKKLNFYGFSKGGGLAEYAYLVCDKLGATRTYANINDIEGQVDQSGRRRSQIITPDKLKEYSSAPDVLGKIVLYNPYHDKLDKTGVEVLETSGDLKIYRNQGDFVSTIFHEYTFLDQTEFVKCDWIDVYNSVDSILPSEYEILNLAFDTAKEKNIFLKLPNFLEAVAGPHMVQNVSKDAFDNEGNAIKASTYSGKNVSYVLFGTEDIFDDLASILDETTVDAYTNYLKGDVPNLLKNVGVVLLNYAFDLIT